MTLDELARLGREMREIQREYDSPLGDWYGTGLRLCAAELAFDNALAEVLDETPPTTPKED
jgi:hypothetical protein